MQQHQQIHQKDVEEDQVHQNNNLLIYEYYS